MSAADGRPADAGQPEGRPSQPSGLMDLLGVAAVLLDADGRIVLWSPQAEDLYGYTAEEALGQYAASLLVHEQHWELMIKLFAHVMGTGESWAGAFPIRHKDGSTRLVEFRNMRLLDDRGDFYALGLATDEPTLRELERDVALSTRLVSQSPIGLAILDTDLRYVAVNPALERMHGIPVKDHLGRHYREIMTSAKFEVPESAMRQVLTTGIPMVDQSTVVGHTPADPDKHAWSISLYRLEDPQGRVLGVADLVVDVTDRYQAANEAAEARRRLALIVDGSARIGTTLEVGQTARELAEVTVPELADVVTVDVLDSALDEDRPAPRDGPAVFRALAVKAAYSTVAVQAVDPPGRTAAYGADRLATQCVRTGRPILVSHVGDDDLARIARDDHAAALLARAGVHSYMLVPLTARGHILGFLGLTRARDPLPFDEDDLALAAELGSRAAVCIDNALSHQSVRNAAEILQRSLLPDLPPHLPGLQIASRYRPAQATYEVGGDWYDVLPLDGDKTALVVGDVMGSGIDAAATMGRLRTATSAFADLDLDPAQVLQHLDKITSGLENYIATCLYAAYDPHRAECHIANAGHLPPALVRTGQQPELLDLPTGTPLGVGGVPFETTNFSLAPGDQLVLYTDGLVEARDRPIDERLDTLLHLLDRPDRSLEETCDRLLHELRRPDDPDDVALLIARTQPFTPDSEHLG
ncbi:MULTISPECIES: SpoIIE family protein phosphatase [unclassified Streptomyces]|uniref:SpoIIE family protein phosphatase n=1 Tax=unclassified Streptomyces TaxID=2593676 RepID=UPI002DDBC519|nr:SpoIIE family protein phosphatase [Streptomyces sp. NBC_01750]WSB04932.1 SpoIIE family protein phosphatase [Streptomyces sp. NBC_01794]WSD30793.1 SpoIIE family protein phosphatase [Streptomyces sp. NBC_01750]